MLNKIMMTGRITTDLTVVTEEDRSYCKFCIAVDQPKRIGIDTVETDTFTCLAFDDNAKSVSFLYSKGGIITFVGSLRKAPDKSVVIIWRNCTSRIGLQLRSMLNRDSFSDKTGNLLTYS